MTPPTDAFEPMIRPVERQAAQTVHKAGPPDGSPWFDCTEAAIYEAPEADWSAPYSFDPMVRAFYATLCERYE
jgi:hypothetical protein